MSSSAQPMNRFEDHRLLTGAGAFVADIQLPEMLHAIVVRSPHAHAFIRKVEVANARNLPGVAAVLTGPDLSEGLREIPTVPLWVDDSILVMNGPGQPVLAGDKVCYVGQAVAIVVAESPELAQDAAELVKVDYEPLPAILDPLEALNDDSKPMHPDVASNVVLRSWRGAGDVDAACDCENLVTIDGEPFECPLLNG